MYKPFSYFQYLVKKYGVSTPTTMLKVEANLMGLRYPLVSGWRERHSEWLNRELDQQEIESFLAGLIKGKRATKHWLEKAKPKEVEDLQRRLVSLQTGIDCILGRDFVPISQQDRDLIREEIAGG